jgi:Leucine-rich repeat (LRR) protein
MIKLPVLMLKRFTKIASLMLVLFIANNSLKAQLLDSLTLDTLTAYVDLQEALKNPDAVIKLVLRKQHLKKFPNEILQFKNLQYLDLSKNSIDEFPDSIFVLQNLQYLACSKNGLKKLTPKIGQLQNLYYLNLNQNDLDALPKQIGNLENLKNLDLWSNNFDEFPPTLNGLTSLQVLDLRNILISEEVQASILLMLPKAKVYMSPSCRCKW